MNVLLILDDPPHGTKRMAAAWQGRPQNTAFDGTAACFVELGDGVSAHATSPPRTGASGEFGGRAVPLLGAFQVLSVDRS